MDRIGTVGSSPNSDRALSTVRQMNVPASVATHPRRLRPAQPPAVRSLSTAAPADCICKSGERPPRLMKILPRRSRGYGPCTGLLLSLLALILVYPYFQEGVARVWLAILFLLVLSMRRRARIAWVSAVEESVMA
jgi:hypothetical protein